ncbi:hypothetical protein [Oribacterium sp. WCC10]|uniref:hypothetical protein n=1 Tax=Oribacterium sp. WCC10 TaxID=1855343 RepID=UPI0008EEA11D|nr:hypothetical protein [Oribacterium sp. WCC10]SFG30023.1 hypothetical protein SAMN05216356_10546 [Oribacterium sp. WCC10]
MSYQAVEGVARYDNLERISTESRWQQYLEMRSRNNNKLDESHKSSERKDFKDGSSEETKESSKVLFERPNQQSLEALKRKVANGDILTASEKTYLQQYDPQTYRKVENRDRELKEYKRLLKQAKTNEELRNAKINHSSVAHRAGTLYAESTVSLDEDFLLDEEKSTYDRVV